MALPADLLNRKQTDFVLWHSTPTAAPPVLVIGEFQPGNPPSLKNAKRIPLAPVTGFTDLFAIPATSCGLTDGTVYHYFFEPADGVQTTDPIATTVDWRLLSNRLPPPFTTDDRQPAAVVKFQGCELVPSDPGGEAPDFSGDPSPATLATNNHLVIYEMPTAWANISATSDEGIGVGTFRDVLALIDVNATGANFDNLGVTQAGKTYLRIWGSTQSNCCPPLTASTNAIGATIRRTSSRPMRNWGSRMVSVPPPLIKILPT